ncbi:MAG TPA: cupin domain-containing protein [Puia sp.]|nr:cupin domain-containing protein [Puia sp.]
MKNAQQTAPALQAGHTEQAAPAAQSDLLTDKLSDKAVVVYPGEGETLTLAGNSCVFKVTSAHSNSQLGVYEMILQPQTIGASLHYHRYTDETFIVTRGVLTIQLGGKNTEIPAGGVVYVPRYTPHSFSNQSNEETQLMLVFNPSHQREGFFHGLFRILGEQPVDAEKFLRLYDRYDSIPVNPAGALPVK